MIGGLALLQLLATDPAPQAPVAAPSTVDPVALVDAGPPPIEPRDDAAADAGPAQPHTIPGLVLNASVDPVVVKFGEPFTLVLTIARDRGVRLELPGAIPDVEGAPRTGDPTRAVVDDAPPPVVPDAGPVSSTPRVKETIRIPFLALDTQDLKTPAFSLTGPGGALVDVPSLSVRVEVEPEAPPPDGGPVDPTRVELEPHAGALAYAVPDSRPWVALAAFASSGALFALVRWAQRRRRLRAPPVPLVPPPPPRPAHEIALERLDALLASGLLQKGETATFVERLMDEVLRDYITARFALEAGTRTTRELVKDLLGVAVAGLDVALVESLLADADLIKFARASIAAETAHQMATRVRTLVETTREKPALEERRS